MQQWNTPDDAHTPHSEYAPCGCSPERVNHLVGLLIDGAADGELNSAELQEVRAELASCELCYQRLHQEERFRAMLNRSCETVDEDPTAAAPRSLRERILVSIRTETVTDNRGGQEVSSTRSSRSSRSVRYQRYQRYERYEKYDR